MVRIGRAASLVILAGCSTDQPTPSETLHPLEAYEGGSKQAEDQYVSFLAGFFGRDPRPGEPLLRGTHAVGTCVAAEFEIDDLEARADVPDDLAVGVFAEPRGRRAQIGRAHV